MSKYLVISTSVELLRLAVDEVMCISSDGNYSTIVLDSGETKVVSIQLGKMEKMIHDQMGDEENLFFRIGKSLIVNHDHIFYINPSRQILELSNRKGFKKTFSASKVALAGLKDYIDNLILGNNHE